MDTDLLDGAIGRCDPDEQRRDVVDQATFLAQLEAALEDRPVVSVALSCPMMERDVVLEIDRGGQAIVHDFHDLPLTRACGDLAAAVVAVLSDLQRAPAAPGK